MEQFKRHDPPSLAPPTRLVGLQIQSLRVMKARSATPTGVAIQFRDTAGRVLSDRPVRGAPGNLQDRSGELPVT